MCSQGVPSLDLVAFLLERLVDPRTVDGAGADLLHRAFLLREDRLGRRENGFGMLLRNGDQAVGVADDDVAGIHRNAAHDDGHVDLPRPVLVGAAMRDAAREDGEAALAQLGRVADRAPDHHPAHAALLRARRHQLADDRVVVESAGVHDDDVARLGGVDRLVDEQVVPGRRAHRERGAAELGAVVHGPELRAPRVEPLHAVGEVRRHHLGELGDELLVGTPGEGEDAKADGGHERFPQTNCTAIPPKGPKSPCKVSPLFAKTTRVNEPARIRCPASSVTPFFPSRLASQATPSAGWPSTPAARPVSSISELRYMMPPAQRRSISIGPIGRPPTTMPAAAPLSATVSKILRGLTIRASTTSIAGITYSVAYSTSVSPIPGPFSGLPRMKASSISTRGRQ